MPYLLSIMTCMFSYSIQGQQVPDGTTMRY